MEKLYGSGFNPRSLVSLVHNEDSIRQVTPRRLLSSQIDISCKMDLDREHLRVLSRPVRRTCCAFALVSMIANHTAIVDREVKVILVQFNKSKRDFAWKTEDSSSLICQ